MFPQKRVRRTLLEAREEPRLRLVPRLDPHGTDDLDRLHREHLLFLSHPILAVLRRDLGCPRAIGLIGRDDLDRAVGVFDGDLAGEAGGALFRVHHLDGGVDLAGPHLAGYLDLDRLSPVIARRACHFLTVEKYTEGVIRRDPQIGLEDLLVLLQVEVELKEPATGGHLLGRVHLPGPDPFRIVPRHLAEHAVLRHPAFGRRVVADPFSFPVPRLEQAHGPESGLAPRRLAAFAIPDAHFPIAFLPRNERPPRVGDVGRLVGRDLPAVPQIALIGLQLL